MKNPIFFILIWIFVLVNIADMITMYFILPAESNPIYLITGSIFYVIGYKVLILCAIIFFYRRGIYPTNFSYYLLLSIVVMSIMILSMGVIANIGGAKNPGYIEAVKDMPKVEKAKSFASVMTIFYFIPIGINLLIFKLYDKSRKKVKIDKRYYKQKKWWQI